MKNSDKLGAEKVS